MALFTDEIMNDGEALQQYDSNILNVASTEAIDVSAKAKLAQEEIATELLLFLERSALEDPMFLMRRLLLVSDVVVTDPLRRWHAYKTLAMVYRDAHNNQLNDRYQGKWSEYERLSASAARTVYQAGIGIVHEPVPKASEPVLTVVPQAVTGVRCFVRVSWLNRSGQEGGASEVVEAACGDGSAVVVGTQTPVGIMFWNIYAGEGPDSVVLQNSLPIPVADTWTVPTSGLRKGRIPGTGQVPECWIVDRHILPRG